MSLVSLKVQTYKNPHYEQVERNVSILVNPEQICSAQITNVSDRDNGYLILDLPNGGRMIIDNLSVLERQADKSEIIREIADQWSRQIDAAIDAAAAYGDWLCDMQRGK